MQPNPVPVSLWRHAGFMTLWTGETLSQFGSQLAQLALPVLAVTLLNATEFQVGLLGAVDMAAFLVIGLPAGAWVDRMLKRRVMLFSDLLRALTLATIPVLWMLHALDMWHLYVVGAIIGVATVFFDVSYQSYIPVLVSRDHVSEANSKLESTAQIARIGGPALGGGLLSIIAAPFLIIVTTVTYLVSFVFLTRIRDTETRAHPEERMPLTKEIAEGIGFVARHPLIRRITASTAIGNFFTTIAMTMLPLLILRELGLSPAVMGIILSVGSVGGLLGAIATPRLTAWIGEGTAIPVSAAILGLFGLLMPLSAMFPQIAVPLLITSEFGSSFFLLLYNITQVSFRQRVCPTRLLGRMNASIRFVVWGVMPIGALLSGVLGHGLGVVPTMWIGAIGAIGASAIVAASPLLGMRKLPDA